MLRKCGVCNGRGYLWEDSHSVQMVCWKCLGAKLINNGPGSEEEING